MRYGLAILVKGEQIYIIKRVDADVFRSEYYKNYVIQKIQYLRLAEARHRFQTLEKNGFTKV